jgi:hypothetical protein
MNNRFVLVVVGSNLLSVFSWVLFFVAQLPEFWAIILFYFLQSVSVIVVVIFVEMKNIGYTLFFVPFVCVSVGSLGRFVCPELRFAVFYGLIMWLLFPMVVFFLKYRFVHSGGELEATRNPETDEGHRGGSDSP